MGASRRDFSPACGLWRRRRRRREHHTASAHANPYTNAYADPHTDTDPNA
ncbi:hypothetical protein SmB9_27560 [Sphingosinicella microcystinivorans]|uniref:Uncharacterized protein n=1 Tax=Sphingosinicella microcystinivorans TaxID=335406 RepID=A0AAD1G1R5_SPHMI|nr:hypothetical protein SmB9_27560 [Sphingosinicella microcystinivorans]